MTRKRQEPKSRKGKGLEERKRELMKIVDAQGDEGTTKNGGLEPTAVGEALVAAYEAGVMKSGNEKRASYRYSCFFDNQLKQIMLSNVIILNIIKYAVIDLTAWLCMVN